MTLKQAISRLTMFASPMDNELFGYLLLAHSLLPRTVDFVLMRPKEPCDDPEPIFMELVLPPTIDESELRYCINDLGDWVGADSNAMRGLQPYRSTLWQVLDYKGIIAAMRSCYDTATSYAGSRLLRID